MWRTILAIVAGLVVWVLIVVVLNWSLRLWLPGYHEAEPLRQYTLTMKIARLTMATIASLGTGAVVRLTAPQSHWAPWVAGLIGLVLVIPDHIHVWAEYPVWYHAYFLLTLVPLVWIGSRLVPQRKAQHSQ
jgi:hypothetical protein